MPTIQPVVVGTDLGEASVEAVSQAAAWAERAGAPLVIVHAAPERLFSKLDAAKTRAAMRQSIPDALAHGRAVEVEVVAGSAHGELIRIADARDAQLLVVGTRGHGRLETALFGSTAQQVVRYAHCPVLVARVSPRSGPVVAAVDFSETSVSVVRAAADEARRRATRVVALHSVYEGTSPLSAFGPLVVSPPEPTETEIEALETAAGETLKSLLEAAGVPPDFVVSRAAPSLAIIERAKASGASLVVVGTRGKTGLTRIALGSVAEATVRQAPCSVLAVRVNTRS